MAIRKELTIRLQNSPGAAARACIALADERINILALQLEAGGVLRLLVDNPLHAAGILRERRYQVEERDVLYTVAANDPGSVGKLARALADAGVNVEYLYETAVEGQGLSAVVIGVPDVHRASAASGI
jgi:hypothetical protein